MKSTRKKKSSRTTRGEAADPRKRYAKNMAPHVVVDHLQKIGLSQSAFCDWLGVSVSAFQQWTRDGSLPRYVEIIFVGESIPLGKSDNIQKQRPNFPTRGVQNDFKKLRPIRSIVSQ